MNQPKTPDNEVARPFGCKCKTLSERVLGDGCDECNKAFAIEMLTDERDELNNEVARLREELKERIENQNTFAMALIEKPEREVARLRNELQGLKSAAQAVVDRWETPLWKDAEPTASVIYRLRDALAPAPEEAVSECIKLLADDVLKLHKPDKAPAPEEPASDWKCPHCGSITGTWFSRVEPMGDICEGCGKAVDEEPVIQDSRTTESEWRELGPDEVICEGDEFLGDYDRWMKCELYVGKRAELLGRVRTRRPLCPNDAPKQEEMPLEDEIETLWEHSEHIDSLTGHMAFKALAKSIRYLRDEIQKLKEK
jgi:hypothetical protein